MVSVATPDHHVLNRIALREEVRELVQLLKDTQVQLLKDTQVHGALKHHID